MRVFYNIFFSIKPFLIKLILNNKPLVFIAHLWEHKKNYPGGFKRSLLMIIDQGPSAFIKRFKQLWCSGSTLASHNIVQNIYHYQIPTYNNKIAKQIENFSATPLISIIMPVYNVEPKWLKKAILSIESQWYSHWELCLVDDASSNQATLDYLKSIANKKINIHFSKKNSNISAASNTALAMTQGKYIALMDHDDELSVDALYEVVKCINNKSPDFIYSDEDKLETNGDYCEPHFKPNYSPDMLFSQNYISHLAVIKKSLINQVKGFSLGLEGAQDYDLYLKVFEQSNKIYHIPKVLYHWRKIPGSTSCGVNNKSYAHQAGKQAIRQALKRRAIKAQVFDGAYPGTYRVKRAIKGEPLISIIVPFKDLPKLLKQCFESILQQTSYQNYEIIGISNNSESQATFDQMQRLKKLDNRISFYELNIPFNYSIINNTAVKKYAKGEYIIFLNNDIEIITQDWIEELLSFAQREEVGAVGAKLYYPNDYIQHAGVILGIDMIAGHSHKHFHRSEAGYFSRLHLNQNLSAVTAACLMLEKSKFLQVEGFNEKHLSVAFNDVDLCLKLRKENYFNVYTPYCEAYHHESVSRGCDMINAEKRNRFDTEIAYMQKIYGKSLKNDPFYNINLTLIDENFSLRRCHYK